MPTFRDMPIKQKLTLIALFASGAALTVACTGFVVDQQIGLRKSISTDATTLARMVGFDSSSALSFNDPSTGRHILEGLRADPHAVAACLYDASGALFATYEREHGHPRTWPRPETDNVRFTRNSLLSFHRIELDGEPVGTIFIEHDLAELQAALLHGLTIAGIVMVGAAGLAYAVATRLQRVISAPIAHLSSVAAAVALNKDYTLRARQDSTDELGLLVTAFNEMLAQIQAGDVELAYERDQLRALLETSPDAIYFKDLQSRLVRVSTSKARKLIEGCPELQALQQLHPNASLADLVVGQTDFDLYVREDAELAYRDEQTIIATGKGVENKVERQILRSGEVLWHLTSKMPWRDKTGKIIGTFGVSKEITDLKRAEEALSDLNKELVAASRMAGMAEVATGVLHNVGNALNSVNVSATITLEQIRRSRVPYLAKVAELLHEHAAHLPAYLMEDPKGRKLPEYLAGFAHALTEEHVALKRELEDLRKNVDHIIEVVAMQQNYAHLGGLTESVALADVIEDAIRMNSAALKRHEITLQRDYRAQPVISTDRHKVLQILVNLIHNAKYACDAGGASNKTIAIRMEQEGPHARISVSDNGIGIQPENLTRIFSHGFTTRTGGHGFGLHSGALAAKDLGGSLVAGSDGPYHGATFMLTLPLFGENTRSTAPFAKRSAAAATIDSGDST